MVAAGWLAATAVGATGGAVAGGAAGGCDQAMTPLRVFPKKNCQSLRGAQGGTLVTARVEDNLVPENEAVLKRQAGLILPNAAPLIANRAGRVSTRHRDPTQPEDIEQEQPLSPLGNLTRTSVLQGLINHGPGQHIAGVNMAKNQFPHPFRYHPRPEKLVREKESELHQDCHWRRARADDRAWRAGCGRPEFPSGRSSRSRFSWMIFISARRFSISITNGPERVVHAAVTARMAISRPELLARPYQG